MEASQLIQHVESFVDSSRSPAQHTSSLKAITSLLMKDALTIEALVKEMGMYLTTTDNVIRARGILLLAELLTALATKSLDSSSIHSLITFFTDRLADWRALHGALVGCLALLRRKCKVGTVTTCDAKAVAQSSLENLQVQSLGQQDRKLCFELLECLLNHYPEAVAPLGENLVYGICESIDGEKDPECLMLVFHIVEVLARLYPEPSSPLEMYSADLFDILGCYFPIHFTHPQNQGGDVKREDLSRALMVAFSSTPLFEPFAVPLLLEKLSSALQLAKVDSLKFLSCCLPKYGADRTAKHVDTIWSSLKDEIFTAQRLSTPVFLDGTSSVENEVVKEALILLEKLVALNDDSFANVVVRDEDMNMIINSIVNFRSYGDIPLETKQKLQAVGCILYVTAKASDVSCALLLKSFFLRLLSSMGLPVSGSSEAFDSIENFKLQQKPNFGAIYLCSELLAACRELAVRSQQLVTTSGSSREIWSSMLDEFSFSLFISFSSILVTSIDSSIHEAEIHYAVKGLQILATCPGGSSQKLTSIFKSVLRKFVTMITTKLKNSVLWRLALNALVAIGSFVQNLQESERALSYTCIVVDEILSLMSLDDPGFPLPLKLEAICAIGATGLNFMLRIVQRLEEATSTNFSYLRVHEDAKSAESIAKIFECYSNKVLPWFHEKGGPKEIPLQFAINIWNQFENGWSFSENGHGKELTVATMRAMKLALAYCSEESQNKVLEKAFSVLSSHTLISLATSTQLNIPAQIQSLQLGQELGSSPCHGDWLLSLFASVIMALHPQTCIPNVKLVLHLFATNLLRGHIPSAQALGSMLNKLKSETNEINSLADDTVKEIVDIVNNSSFWDPCDNESIRRLLPTHAITGLAWVAKGLLMRGHERVKDMTMIFLKILVTNGRMVDSSLKQNLVESADVQEVLQSVLKNAADAFSILMSDSEDCLNKKLHAIIRPLYKQRYFSTTMPIFLLAIQKSDSSITRYMIYRAFGHVISNAPLIAILGEAKQLITVLLDILSILSGDALSKDMVYSLLLVLSAILTEKNGHEALTENAHLIIDRLTRLVFYPHMMVVRETAVQCLVAMSGLPHTRIYPMRKQVLHTVSKALGDPKRVVRQEAVRCRQAWSELAKPFSPLLLKPNIHICIYWFMLGSKSTTISLQLLKIPSILLPPHAFTSTGHQWNQEAFIFEVLNLLESGGLSSAGILLSPSKASGKGAVVNSRNINSLPSSFW